MTKSGIEADGECKKAFQSVKDRSLKWVIFKIDDKYSKIEIEETSTTGDYAAFREKLINAKSKDKKGNECIGGRYAVYDLEYETAGEGMRSKIAFIAWVPDDAPQYPRMMYSSSKQAFKLHLDVGNEIQANDSDDIEYDSVISKVFKGR